MKEKRGKITLYTTHDFLVLFLMHIEQNPVYTKYILHLHTITALSIPFSKTNKKNKTGKKIEGGIELQLK